MMTVALITLSGVSLATSLLIVAALYLNSRSRLTEYEETVSETGTEKAAGHTFSPAYSH